MESFIKSGSEETDFEGIEWAKIVEKTWGR